MNCYIPTVGDFMYGAKVVAMATIVAPYNDPLQLRLSCFSESNLNSKNLTFIPMILRLD